MLPHPAHEAILGELPKSIWFTVGEGAFPNNPDASEWEVIPAYRWAGEDFEDPVEEPFEHVTLNENTGGVLEDRQPLDEFFGFARIDDETVDADAVTATGSLVYDVLDIMVTAQGSETRGGLTLTANQRARALCREIHHWFLYRWETRPLDTFDHQGMATDDTDTAYAEELSPPIRVDGIPGRGPADVTDAVDANGAQYNAAVELHYVDSVLEYEYVPESAETTTTVDQ